MMHYLPKAWVLLSVFLSLSNMTNADYVFDELVCNSKHTSNITRRRYAYDRFYVNATNDWLQYSSLYLDIIPDTSNTTHSLKAMVEIIQGSTKAQVSFSTKDNGGFLSVDLLLLLEESTDIAGIYYFRISTNESLSNSTNFGAYDIILSCPLYSEPMAAEAELNIPSNLVGNISCGDYLRYDGSNASDPYAAIAYYRLNIFSDTQRPVSISTCNSISVYSSLFGFAFDYIPDTFMYFLYKKADQDYEMIDFNDDSLSSSGIDTCAGAAFNHTELMNGEYIIAVGVYNAQRYAASEQWQWEISVECGATQYVPGEYELAGVIIAVVCAFLICVALFFVFYCKQLKTFERKHGGITVEKKKSYRAFATCDDDKECEDEYIQEERVEDVHITAVHEQEVTIDVDKHEEEDDNDDYTDIIESVIQSSENESDLDIYQVLAFRYFDQKSHKLRLFKPFETIGIDYPLINLSSYHRAYCVCFVIAILQCVGITVILWSATAGFLNERNASGVRENRECHWTLEDWQKVWMFKFLAFLWSIVITLRINIDLNKFKNNGFTQIIISVAHNDYFKFYQHVNLNIVQVGYLINLYTLLIAVIGSYWVVYSSDTGAGAIDMVLDAVALFFMIELDDLMVTDTDYADIHQSMKTFLVKYKNERSEEQTYSNKVGEEKILNRLVHVSHATGYISFFISAITVICGSIAPWIILLCYG